MNVLGLSITRAKQVPSNLAPIPVDSRGWSPLIREPYAGAWQQNREIQVADVLTSCPAWACVTLIAADISKLWLRLVELQGQIWVETENPAYSPVLRRPNRYQNRIKFIEYWVLSKLIHGNTYVLKQRDNRKVVVALYILDPTRVRVLVASDGAVYYQLSRDNLSSLTDVTVPASEIIHDIMVPLYHPLVGVSAIHACGLAAMQGIRIQQNSEQFFANNSQPGGLLTAPGAISPDNAKRVQDYWEGEFAGNNVGRVAVLGNGMTYTPLSVTAEDAQLIEQLKWSAETVCSCFHVPPYMIGIPPLPNYSNVQALNLQYYNQALQALIESLELCLDEGLEIRKGMGVEFDLSALLRMDSLAQMEMAERGVKAAIFTPNESRADFNKPPMVGGDALYLQQQNFSLEALAKRDQSADPFGTAPPPAPAAPENDDDTANEEEVDDGLDVDDLDKFATYLRKELAA